MSENKSVLHQPLFVSKKSRLILLITIGLTLLALAVFIWLVSEGKIASLAEYEGMKSFYVHLNAGNEFYKDSSENVSIDQNGLKPSPAFTDYSYLITKLVPFGTSDPYNWLPDPESYKLSEATLSGTNITTDTVKLYFNNQQDNWLNYDLIPYLANGPARVKISFPIYPQIPIISSLRLIFRFNDLISPPADFKVESISNDCHSLNLSWNKVDNAAGYRIFASACTNDANICATPSLLTEIDNPDTLSYIHEDLNERDVYNYSIQSFDGAGNTSTLVSKGGKVPACDHQAPTQPQNFIFSSTTSNTLSDCYTYGAFWDASTDNVGVDHYTLIGEGPVNYEINIPGDQVEYGQVEYGNLIFTQDGSYTFHVTAYDAARNASEPSESQTIEINCFGSPSPTPTPTSTSTISPSPPIPIPTIIPDPPSDIHANKQTRDSITLSWQNVEDENLIGFIIYNENDVEVGYSTRTQYTVYGLECGKNYQFYIKAVYLIDSQIHLSQASEKIETATSSCLEPIPTPDYFDFNIAVSGSSVTLSWNALEGASSYRIYDCNNNLMAITQDNSFTFENFYNGDYCFYVIPFDAQGKALKEGMIKKSVSVTQGLGSKTGVGQLVSTGAALWFNILLAAFSTFAIGYLLFRKEFWQNR